MSAVFPGDVLDLTDHAAVAIAVVDTNGDQLPGTGSLPVTVANTPLPVTLTQVDPANATITSVASTVSSTTILAANAARHQFIIYNQSTKILTIAYAATASANAFTLQIPANGSYESSLNGYTGVISGFWSAVNGNARVTEITT